MPATFEAPHYPIVYVRGYAATQNEIEETVATPYMGFNLGSTKVRLNADKKPMRFFFESPLIRLIKDYDYDDCYHAGDFLHAVNATELPDGTPVAAPKARTIWIFRYYDAASKDLGQGKRPAIIDHAVSLRRFILEIRDFLCEGDKKSRKDFRANLVAHSMGGLICRAYLQNVCRNGIPDNRALEAELELADRKDPENHLVNKFFTYGTPHRGIDLLGLNIPNLGSFDALQVSTFNRDNIAKLLALSQDAVKNEEYHSLDGHFDPRRTFCFVGTNYRDYDAFFGLSRHATGRGSDGLVMCENAYVKSSARAYAYRAHSGPYGIVNSEEGYQNLRRFLFGTTRVDAHIEFKRITFPEEIQAYRDKGKTVRASYQIESAAKVRGSQINLHERREDHESATARTYEELLGKDETKRDPVFLFSGFLDFNLGRPIKDDNGKKTGNEMVFAVQVAVKRPVYEVENRFLWDEHIEGADLYNEVVLFRVQLMDGAKQANLSYGFASQDGSGASPHKARLNSVLDDKGRAMPGRFQVRVPLGDSKPEETRPGYISADLVLEIEDVSHGD